MSILTTNSLSQVQQQNWLKRLAADINKSWRLFKIGVGLFCLGVVLILAGTQFWPLLQIPGLVLLAIGGLYAIRGYFGILAYRMTQSFKPTSSSFDKDK